MEKKKEQTFQTRWFQIAKFIYFTNMKLTGLILLPISFNNKKLEFTDTQNFCI